jgi:hypothetical protein
VASSCPDYCGFVNAKTPERMAACKRDCTPAALCKLKGPLRSPGVTETPLDLRLREQLMACIHQSNPHVAVEPPARKVIPSDEPKFSLKRIPPTVPVKPQLTMRPKLAAAKVVAKPLPPAPAAPPEVHWKQRSSPSWNKLAATASPPPAAAK